MKVERDKLGLAEEFAVASELCRRNIYAQLTLGLRKRTDILIETQQRMWRIQVKSKQSREWPGCKGIHGEGIILVFVDYENKNDTKRPDFYVLTVQDWEDLLERELILTEKVERNDVRIEKKCSYLERWLYRDECITVRDQTTQKEVG